VKNRRFFTSISNTTGNKGFLRLREKFGMTHIYPDK
jgi:hypothetical protein